VSEITRILAEHDDPQAAAKLLPLVYAELRRLAAKQLAHERPGQTLDATALVHEAYLRLVSYPPDSPALECWANRRHFFAAAAEAMRRILVENARRKRRRKRGGDRQRAELPELTAPQPSDDLLALDEALALLVVEDPAKAELVKLRFFAGLSVEDAARCLGISRATADRWWAFSRAWLFEKIRAERKNS
jgi:RNA polymerase sigma factor (TIGR02999 family)